MQLPFKISNKHQAVLIREDPRVGNIIPHVRKLNKNGNVFYLVPHKPSEAKLLTNLGYKVPPPIVTHYDWQGTTPFASQKETAAMLTTNHKAFVLNGLGTGKTRATLFAVDYLKSVGEINKVLVVAPLSTLTCVWEKEVFEVFPELTTKLLYGTKAQRVKALNEDADIYIINHDGVKVLLKEIIASKKFDLVIIDEIASFRNARTNRWKALNTIVRDCRWAWGLTGTPTPNAPTDAWAQCRLLVPEKVTKYFKAFQQETMRQVSQFRWVPKNDANDTVYKAMQPAVRFTIDECVDLPETIYSTREAEMSKDQAAAYKDMMNEFHAEFAAKEITAANEGVKINKLLQIAGGYVYSNDRSVVSIDISDRLKTLKEIIEECNEKVIVFAPFVHIVTALYKELASYTSVEVVYGDTKKGDRDNIFTAFQNAPNPKVLLAHPQCMSHGLTLTVASTIVWFSPILSLEIYEQANGRIARPGQKNITNIIHIEGSPIEKRVYSRLRSRSKMQGILLDLFKTTTDQT